MEINLLNGSNARDQQDRSEDAELAAGTQGGAEADVEADAEAEAAEQPHVFRYTKAVAAIIDSAEAIAQALRHHEVTVAHLIAGLALESAGQAELRKRKLDVGSVHQAALQCLSREPTVPAQQCVPMSEALRGILLRAEALARGCETAKRAISTQDVVAALLEGEASDPVRKLLTPTIATTPAEEARDHAKALRDTLDRFIGEMSGAIAKAQSKLDSAVAQLDAQGGTQQDLQARLIRTESAVARAAERQETKSPTVRIAASWAIGVVLAGVCGYLLGKGLSGFNSVTSLFRGWVA